MVGTIVRATFNATLNRQVGRATGQRLVLTVDSTHSQMCFPHKVNSRDCANNVPPSIVGNRRTSLNTHVLPIKVASFAAKRTFHHGSRSRHARWYVDRGPLRVGCKDSCASCSASTRPAYRSISWFAQRCKTQPNPTQPNPTHGLGWVGSRRLGQWVRDPF